MFEKSDKVDFKINVKVIENKESADFAAGIVIKAKGDIYYFALDSERIINLDRRGKEGVNQWSDDSDRWGRTYNSFL